MSKTIYVYANWQELEPAVLVGTLNSSMIRNKEVFRFSYDHSWIKSKYSQQIDSDLHLYSGEQYTTGDQNFRVFLDSCPDRWGRLLMQRREAVYARREKRQAITLNESDYLLGVHDDYRLGAIRFKIEQNGDFLDNDHEMTAPPLSSLRELEYAAFQIDNDADIDSDDYLKWLKMLMAPGSSLGGARPKSCVVDKDGALWIAKFPNKLDDVDVGAWEYVAYKLAITSGIEMSECYIKKYNSIHHTFLTRRFDRTRTSRKHFSSAMAQLEHYDGDSGVSYLELAEFLMKSGANTKADLAQLWRRIIFSIAISNTDDHLRNHGFLFTDKGWVLSPAYDINPVINASGLHLNINEHDNSLSFGLAFEVIKYFQLSEQEAMVIYKEVMEAVSHWSEAASEIGISRNEQKIMSSAFKYISQARNRTTE